MQGPYHEVLALYSAEVLHKPDYFPEPEDHLAIELEFMVFLCRISSEALQAGVLARSLEYLAKQRLFISS
jgi:putative dimethyl sulfoxide reductase chaperone